MLLKRLKTRRLFLCAIMFLKSTESCPKMFLNVVEFHLEHVFCINPDRDRYRHIQPVSVSSYSAGIGIDIVIFGRYLYRHRYRHRYRHLQNMSTVFLAPLQRHAESDQRADGTRLLARQPDV